MKLPCEEIKGYNELSEPHQAIFRETYDYHYRVMGTSMREKMTPASVELVEKRGKSYLKAAYSNGEWFHYLPGGVYY